MKVDKELKAQLDRRKETDDQNVKLLTRFLNEHIRYGAEVLTEIPSGTNLETRLSETLILLRQIGRVSVTATKYKLFSFLAHLLAEDNMDEVAMFCEIYLNERENFKTKMANQPQPIQTRPEEPAEPMRYVG